MLRGHGQCRSARAEGLLQRADKVNRARLLAFIAPGLGSWLTVLPCPKCLGNIGLRIGAPFMQPHAITRYRRRIQTALGFN